MVRGVYQRKLRKEKYSPINHWSSGQYDNTNGGLPERAYARSGLYTQLTTEDNTTERTQKVTRRPSNFCIFSVLPQIVSENLNL